ncbi:Alcohol dehydrogenase, C-terminal [Cynara cardunculus var. scolymus]|uniref:Alcohol dehydrogenase, C-terminal n=1 Tax=Cynara cardunculus var. scolymus TaxID=59895 RepID=A0A103XUT1_CYNCS|nr:Alcohol dehydrogenase, C-terminal [Cynara cardunculus var. scolymus]
MGSLPETEHPVKALGYAARDISGVLSPINFSRRETGDEDVRFKVSYCGVCHSDLHSVKNEWSNAKYPVIPGHEIVGVVTEVGSKVKKVKVGDKVGVGCMVGSCHSCDQCASDQEQYCLKMVQTYNDATMTTYGGYSDHMVANEHFIISWPENLPLDGGAPLLCAGITVYSPMRYYGLDKPGMHVGVVGLGGLGHVAVKFLKALGVKGAVGTMDGIIDTVSADHPLVPLIGLLRPNGKLVLVGAPTKPHEIPAFPLLFGRKLVGGSLIGGIKETQEMIDFAAKHNITAAIELIPIDYINTAMERLAKADVRYRFVIDVANTLK